MAKITWAGQSCFQISVTASKETCDIVIDPFDEKIGLKMPNFSADVVLVSHGHPDHNNVKGVKGNPRTKGAEQSSHDGSPRTKEAEQSSHDGSPFIIDNLGEYEKNGVFVQGIDSFHDDVEGKERGRNTIFIIEAEDMRFCHLGDFGQKQLTDEQLDKIGHVDILMIPVGGTYTISAHEATKVIGQIEPKMVIPMHYALPKMKTDVEGVDIFLKAMGKKEITAQDKLTIKASLLPKESEMEIVVLKN
ncbi:MAG: hypothetical protein A3C50_02440 [Candidatus Staskawiczbacteria bacterium RIFCSPHIGHO2_02_FULL_43_16]|uniref:MBL fold metallo-hydrolase n=1 Tax=Candidatus Staskawiczbacteria bacterium RIFCSPHIGHO2_01_FULL_41_41 TaxID=1802203 RepID=A0A1G2HVE5_9BACT|nr:MAG: hypothetical protein A2822_01645 [Candidatus Staskawiczbacteria bacterium RIFCSPHIGHO2_01_FULL_41_41]OGZ68146.1 MAG: hypothetical protein A3C50_02440 [Candidatus Staskawiczbacteria bacterium RIFCSPHIGHO2_02_FULL_43_16]OGZ74936.1 MAG: hypothetical protein A3A12_03835 [Candidatus Staskawiczbacteria bacterium RIFCSPLOWO2_01_FULL_43_17b]